MAGKGVRVATAYVEVAADTSGIGDQIKDALNKAGGDASKSAGEKIGKDLKEGINKGMGGSSSQPASPVPSLNDTAKGTGKTRDTAMRAGEQIGKDLKEGINKGMGGSTSTPASAIPTLDDAAKGQGKTTIAARQAGEKIGKEVSEGVKKGMDEAAGGSGGLGKQIREHITTGADPKAAGRQIGKEISEGVKDETGGSFLRDVWLAPVRDLGRNIKDQLKGGDIKGALDDIRNATKSIGLDHIGDLLTPSGQSKDAMDQFSADAAQAQAHINDIGSVLEGLPGKIGTAGSKMLVFAGEIGVAVEVMKELMPIANDLDDKIRAMGGPGATAEEWTPEKIGARGGTAFGADRIRQWMGRMFGYNPEDVNLFGIPWLGVHKQKPEFYGGGDQFTPSAAATPTFVAGLGYVPVPKKPEGPSPTPLKPDQIPFVAGLTTPGGPGAVFGPSGTPVTSEGGGYGPQVKGVYGAPGTGYWWPEKVPAAVPAATAGMTANQAVVSTPTASISVGTANISGISLPTVAAAPTSVPSGKPVKGFWGYQQGGPIDQDQLAQLHAGEHVLTAGDVNAIGGQDAVMGARQQLGKGGGQDFMQVMRTAGFVPSAAGQQTVAGTSSLAGLLNLGNQAVGGLIDAGASAAETAISVAGGVSSFGAGGQAAGAVAAPFIQMGAQEAKRAATYGFQLASIWADALMEQAFPFGAPRWLGYDYTKFMPNINVGALATTTTEKAIQQAMGGDKGQPGQQPGGPVNPELMAGMAQGLAIPPFGQKPPAQGAAAPPPGLGPASGAVGGPGALQAGINAGAGAGAAPTIAAPPPPPPPTSPAPSQPSANAGIFSALGIPPFDEGGWMMPGQPGINLTNRPELVLSPQQLDAANSSGYGRGDTYHITAVDAEDVARQIDARKKLASMQYSGRP
jgi:hypothetical protein